MLFSSFLLHFVVVVVVVGGGGGGAAAAAAVFIYYLLHSLIYQTICFHICIGGSEGVCTITLKFNHLSLKPLHALEQKYDR